MPAETAVKPSRFSDRRVQLALLALAVVLTRLPFIGAGYGIDPDAWRVFNSARRLFDTGVYYPSRHLGAPVQEFTTALFTQGGPWAVNGISCAMSAVSAVAFATWLRRLSVKNDLALAFALVCVPVVYIASTSTIDYVWALAFVLCAVVFATDGKALLSGLCAGLAIGTRVSSGAMLLPLALLIGVYTPEWRRRAKAIAQLSVVALGVGLPCYVPALLRPGYSLSMDAVPRAGAFERATLDVWGVLGCVALVWASLASLASRGKDARKLPERERLGVSVACAAAVVVYVLAFMRAPLEPGYLVPIVPFTIALAALWSSNFASLVFAALLCVSPFYGSERAVFYGKGPILEDAERRDGQLRKLVRILDASRKLPAHSIVLAGTRRPELEALLPTDSPENQRIYGLVTPEECEKFKREGYRLYVADRATEGYLRRMTGVHTHAYGAKLLF